MLFEFPLLDLHRFHLLRMAPLFFSGLALIHAEITPVIEWQRSFGGSASDTCQVVKQTIDGGYILGGTSSSGVSGNKTSSPYGGDDYWVIKIDGNGNKLWEKSFGGSGSD